MQEYELESGNERSEKGREIITREGKLRNGNKSLETGMKEVLKFESSIGKVQEGQEQRFNYRAHTIATHS